jgi:predicted RNA-binding protein with RPS1 domain
MDLERLNRRLKALAENPADLTELGRLTRDVGHALPSATLQELRELRAEVAAVRDGLEGQDTGAAFVSGLLFGLVEVAVAYEAELQAVTEREELRSLISEGIHLGLLRELGDGPRLPRELVRALATSDAQVSRALRDLRALGLVDLMAPGALGDQRTRPHRLTPEGRAFLRTLQEERGKDSDQEAAGEVEESAPVLGQIYRGTVRRVEPYGAFVEILKGAEGLVHISELAPYRVREVSDVVQMGDEIPVKVIRMEPGDLMRFSRKEAILESGEPGVTQEAAVTEVEDRRATAAGRRLSKRLR